MGSGVAGLRASRAPVRLLARLRRRSPVDVELDEWMREQAAMIVNAIGEWEARRRQARRERERRAA